MPTFQELVSSRRAWIDEVLQPWCRLATRADLLQAEAEWGDIAGKVDPQSSLWSWAWSRFPDLVHEGLSGVDETRAVRVTLRDGTSVDGFPDGRRSAQGRLMLVTTTNDERQRVVDSGPHSIDDIESVRII